MTWAGQPVAGVRWEVSPLGPLGVPSYLIILGSATTGPDGRFRITSLPATHVYPRLTSVPEGFAGSASGSSAGVTLCADRIYRLGETKILRWVSGLSVREGDTVAPGPLQLSWTPMQFADRYCVLVYISGPTGYGDQVGPSWCGAGTSYVTSALSAGQEYILSVTAAAAGELIGTSGTRVRVQ